MKGRKSPVANGLLSETQSFRAGTQRVRRRTEWRSRPYKKDNMSHTYSRIWMHYVWSPKDRAAILSNRLITALIKHYKTKYAKGGDIYVDTANGVEDHFHLLVGQKPVLSASQVANQVKGESSHWINSNDFIPEKFAWQEGYGVFSVSHSQVQRLREYIKNQQEHHKKVTFEEEYRKFLKANDIEIDEDIGKVKGRKRPKR